MENLPCITVGMLKHQLASLPDDTKVYAWAPGSHCPVAGVIHYKNPSGEKCLLEINVPDDAALARG